VFETLEVWEKPCHLPLDCATAQLTVTPASEVRCHLFNSLQRGGILQSTRLDGIDGI
jgi:hypothetical protein